MPRPPHPALVIASILRRALPVVLLLAALGPALPLAAPCAWAAGQENATTLAFATTPLATTPQLPFWRALAQGDLPDLRVEVTYWKNLDDLRAMLLAGKGDLWLGHVDGFAQAAMRGAPVTLLAVTGWRKFYFLTDRNDLNSASDILALPAGTRVAVAPPQAPGLAVMRAMEVKGAPAFAWAPYEPMQLALETTRGAERLLLLPEPVVTQVLRKAPDFRAVASVEDIYGRLTGQAARIPYVALAMRSDLAQRNPDLARRIVAAMQARAVELAQDPMPGVNDLPEAFEEFLPRDIVRASLARDTVLVEPIGNCRREVQDYLAMVYPKSVTPEGASALPETFWGLP